MYSINPQVIGSRKTNFAKKDNLLIPIRHGLWNPVNWLTDSLKLCARTPRMDFMGVSREKKMRIAT